MDLKRFGKWNLLYSIFGGWGGVTSCKKGIPSLLCLFDDLIEGRDSNKNVATAARSTA